VDLGRMRTIGSTKSPGAILVILAKREDPEGGTHDCRDAGGRATQEQLPRMPGAILPLHQI